MGYKKYRSLIVKKIALLLTFTAIQTSFSQEYTAPLLYNGNIYSAESNITSFVSEGNGTFDSTFNFSVSNLEITSIFDDFSSDKFVDYSADFTDPGVTSVMYHRLMNEGATAPLAADIILCDSTHARRDSVFITSNVGTAFSYYDFPEVKVQLNDLQNYPVITQSRTLFEECYVIIDSVIDGIAQFSSDTVFYNGTTDNEPDFFQDSARIFLADLNDPNKIWIDSFACRNFGLAYQPWSLGVVTLDGVDEKGRPYDLGNSSAYERADYLTSKPINLAGKTDVYLDFIYQAQGNCDAPEAIDSLVLQFYFPQDDKWLTPSWWSEGDKLFSTWDTAHVIIPPFLLVDGFQFRFYNKASTSGWLDHWHIDYIRLRENQLPGLVNFNDLAISEPPHTLLKDYISVPWDHFKNSNPTDKMLDEVVLNVYNCHNTDSGQLPGAFQAGFMGAIDGGPYNIGVTSSWGVGITQYPIPIKANYTYDNGITGQPQAAFDIQMNIATDGAPGSKNSFPDNDTTYFKQEFKNYYAYDDGSAELAYGVTGNRSLLAYKFEAYEADTLTGILMSFLPTVKDLSGNIFLLTVWSDNNGEPGEILYQDDFFSPHYPEYVGEKNGFRYYTFADEVGISVPKTFYVGWDQIEDERLNIGLDMNIPNKDKIFYNTTGTWKTSAFEGSLLIRPVFSTGLNYTLHNPKREQNSSSISVYPNPTSGILTIQGINASHHQIELYDLSGRLISSEQAVNKLDLSFYENGIYLLQIKDKIGNLIDIKKVTKL